MIDEKEEEKNTEEQEGRCGMIWWLGTKEKQEGTRRKKRERNRTGKKTGRQRNVFLSILFCLRLEGNHRVELTQGTNMPSLYLPGVL